MKIFTRKCIGTQLILLSLFLVSSLLAMNSQLVPVAHFSNQPHFYQNNSNNLSIDISPSFQKSNFNYKELDYQFQSADPRTKSVMYEQTNAIISVLQSLCGDCHSPIDVLSAQMNLMNLSHVSAYINEPFNAVREQILDLLFDKNGSLKTHITPETPLQIARLYADFMLKFCPNDEVYFKQLERLAQAYPTFKEILAHDKNGFNKFMHRLGNDFKELLPQPVDVERLRLIQSNPVNQKLSGIANLIGQKKLHEALALSRDSTIVAQYPHLYEQLKARLINTHHIISEEHLTAYPADTSFQLVQTQQAQQILDQHFLAIQYKYHQELTQLYGKDGTNSALYLPPTRSQELLNQRNDALCQTLHSDGPRTWQQYQLEESTSQLLNRNTLERIDFSTCYGDSYQHQLQSEFVSVVNQIAPLAEGQKEISSLIAQCAATGCNLNQVGQIQKATSIADFCWAACEYAKASAQAHLMALGKSTTNLEYATKNTLNALADLVMHSISEQPIVIQQEAHQSNVLVEKMNAICAMQQDEYRLYGSQDADLAFVSNVLKLHQKAVTTQAPSTIRDYIDAVGRGVLKAFNPILHPIETIKETCYGMSQAALHYFRCAVREDLINDYLFTNPARAALLIEEQVNETQACLHGIKHVFDTANGPEKLQAIVGALGENLIGFPLFNKIGSIIVKTAGLPIVNLGKKLATACIKEGSYAASIEDLATVAVKAAQEAPLLASSLDAAKSSVPRLTEIPEIIVQQREWIDQVIRVNGKGYVPKELYSKIKPRLLELKQKLNGNFCMCLGKPMPTSGGMHRFFIKEVEEIGFGFLGCEKLSKVFDFTFSTPMGVGVKKPVWVDYEHIFMPCLSKNCKRNFFKLDGFHHDYLGKIQDAGIFEFKNVQYAKNSIYKAEWHYQGASKYSTFFPKDWSPSKVIQKIEESLKNVVELEQRGTNRFKITGKTQEGLFIETIIDIENLAAKVVTSYPSWERLISS